jgi:dTDP-4-dehydrorhamnose 3,5-epimerase
VVVDLRTGSPTYARYVSVELTAKDGALLFVPEGYAHGFMALEPNCEVAYKASDFYAPECEGGIRYNDPEIGIRWPLPTGPLVSSPKDRLLPFLSEFSSPFSYDGKPLPGSLI